MNSYENSNILEEVISRNLSLESKIDALYGITKNVLDKGAFRDKNYKI